LSVKASIDAPGSRLRVTTYWGRTEQDARSITPVKIKCSKSDIESAVPVGLQANVSLLAPLPYAQFNGHNCVNKSLVFGQGGMPKGVYPWVEIVQPYLGHNSVL
jgi:hypothetical protein